MRPVLHGVFILLVLIGLGASGAHYFREPYNLGFLEHPFVVGAHVVLGGVYLLLMPLQFLGAVRRRAPGYHRGAGRVLVGVGAVVGASGLFMALVIPFSGWWERVIIGIFAGYFLAALWISVRHIRARRVALHREWMIRSVSIALAISTMRLVFIPSLIVFGPPTNELAATLSIISFTVAFVLHTVAAELWIHYTRQASVALATATAGSPA